MSRRTETDRENEVSYDERSRKWREEHDIEPYALEWEDEAVDLEDPDDE